MAKTTSIETYYAIKEQGLLSKLRFFVYDIIYHHGPITISQMVRIAAKDVTNTGSFTGRISELERAGVIGQNHIGPCPVTGREVIFWVTTDSLPKDYKKPESNKEKIERLQKELSELNERYEKLRKAMKDVFKEMPQARSVIYRHYPPKQTEMNL